MERRRHFHTSGRTLLDFHDDVLSGAADTGGIPSALFSALEAPRRAAMRDIVSTIQAEQDEIIRLDHQGVLVVEGGPGTGKTALALHRIAFLLYQQRETLARRGVLVVGPNAGFLRYIGSVLPSLGETDVVFHTQGELFPGVVTSAEDAQDIAAAKGRLDMVELLRRAVADRQELPATPIEIALGDVTIRLDGELTARAREHARAAGVTHNAARRIFRDKLGTLLVRQAVCKIGEGWLEQDDPRELYQDIMDDVRAQLRVHPDFHAAVRRLWPVLTPQRLLAELLGSVRRLHRAGAAPELYRADGAAWTVSDVPLLDEAAELLGVDTTGEERRKRAQAAAEREYAGEVLQILDSHGREDSDSMLAADVIDAGDLAERQEETDHRDLAVRAAADRNWAYGHLVVDEAQELSPMGLRVLMRRCPSRSALLVGDLAQQRYSGGEPSWSALLSRYVGDRWCYRRLSVNYRTPSEIMDLALGVLRRFNPGAEPPISARHGEKPLLRMVEPATLADTLRETVLREAKTDERRSVAVIGTAETLTALGVVRSALTPAESKGLEFDVVIVVCPERILEASPADLYVALTRPTQRLIVLHTGELPSCMNG